MKVTYLLIPGYLASLTIGAIDVPRRPPSQNLIRQELQGSDQAINEASRHLYAHGTYHQNLAMAACSQTAIGNAVACKQGRAMDHGKMAFVQQLKLASDKLERVHRETEGLPLRPLNQENARKANIRANKSAREARHSFADFRLATANARNKSQHLVTAAVATSKGDAGTARHGLKAAAAVDRGPNLAKRPRT